MSSWTPEMERYTRKCEPICACKGVGFYSLNVPVGHRWFGAAMPCICKLDNEAAERAQRLRRQSGIEDAEMRQWSFQTFDPRLSTVPVGQKEFVVRKAMAGVKQQCEQYAENPSGWLILYGPTGAGKTHLAYAIAGKQLDEGKPVYACSVPTMLQMWRNGFAHGDFERRFEHTRDVRLLVLDDLGVQRNTDWTMEQLYELVNWRYVKKLPMVVTTNVPLEDSGLDKRLVSRMLEGTEVPGGFSHLVRLPCADVRPKLTSP